MLNPHLSGVSGILSKDVEKDGRFDDRLSQTRPYRKVSEGQHIGAFSIPWRGLCLPHLKTRHPLHLEFIQHSQCRAAAATTQTTTNTKTAAITPITPGLKWPEPPAAFWGVSVGSGVIVIVSVGAA